MLKVSWDRASLSEQSFVEQTQLLSEAPVEGFVPQIDVTVAVALLIDRAAETKVIASQVLHMLLTGRVGDKSSWVPVRNRIAKILKGLSKYSAKSPVLFSPQSAQQRLGSAFYLPSAISYSDILTHHQQKQAEASGSRGSSKNTLKCCHAVLCLSSYSPIFFHTSLYPSILNCSGIFPSSSRAGSKRQLYLGQHKRSFV